MEVGRALHRTPDCYPSVTEQPFPAMILGLRLKPELDQATDCRANLIAVVAMSHERRGLLRRKGEAASGLRPFRYFTPFSGSQFFRIFRM